MSGCGCAGAAGAGPAPLSPRFAEMVDHALAWAEQAGREGRPLVGIMCEYTPREVILAAGAVPVCLCGGSQEMAQAAEEHLPAGVCPLIRSTYGFHLTGENPFLERCALLVAETTCDGKKKMYELLAEKRRMQVLELTQKPDDPDALVHWRAELVKLAEVLAGLTGRRVDEAGLRAAIALMDRERALRLALADLMQADEPPLTGRELLDLKSLISGIPEDLAEYERLLRELPRRPSPMAGRRPLRVLLTGVPTVHGAERVVDLLEQHGCLVVAQENCTGLKPVLRQVGADAADPCTALARHYLHLPCSVMTPNDRRLESLTALARRFRAEAVVDLAWHGCLTYDIEAARVKRLCETRLGLPCLRIVTGYEPADSARLAVRIEALVETARARRA